MTAAKGQRQRRTAGSLCWQNCLTATHSSTCRCYSTVLFLLLCFSCVHLQLVLLEHTVARSTQKPQNDGRSESRPHTSESKSKCTLVATVIFWGNVATCIRLLLIKTDTDDFSSPLSSVMSQKANARLASQRPCAQLTKTKYNQPDFQQQLIGFMCQ